MQGGEDEARETLPHTHTLLTLLQGTSQFISLSRYLSVCLSVCFLVGSSRVMANDFHSFVFDFPNCNVSISVCRLPVPLSLSLFLLLCRASLVFRLCDECATFVKLAQLCGGEEGGVAAALNQLESLYILAESHRQRCNPLAVN